jgi:hypothetical protein
MDLVIATRNPEHISDNTSRNYLIKMPDINSILAMIILL